MRKTERLPKSGRPLATLLGLWLIVFATRVGALESGRVPDAFVQTVIQETSGLMDVARKIRGGPHHSGGACPASAGQVLSCVMTRVLDAARAGRKPVVIFDIDETLLTTDRPRFLSLQDAAATGDLPFRFPRETQAIRELTAERAKGTFELSELLEKAGVRTPGYLDAVKPAWQAAFTSGVHALTLLPIPGAPQYVRRLRDSGATIVYLTARDSARFAMSTRESLASHRFPATEDRVQFIFKSDISLSDLEHKRGELARIGALGDVVAVFEDEVANLNAISQRFLGITAVLVIARKRAQAAAAAPDTPRIDDYLPVP